MQYNLVNYDKNMTSTGHLHDMAQVASASTPTPCLKLKGTLVPITTLELLRFDPAGFATELRDKVRQAPNLLVNHPVILSLEKYEDVQYPLPDLGVLVGISREVGLVLVGLRAEGPGQIAAAQQAGLPVFAPTRASRSGEPEQPVQQQPAAEVDHGPAAQATPVQSTLVVTQPVRSGQQIYAPGGDLIVLAPVSAGAELLADGHIHVYGPLRGRALAGVRGLVSARIFCQSLEAELVSIAGHYKISEDLQGPHWKKGTHLALNGERLTLTSL